MASSRNPEKVFRASPGRTHHTRLSRLLICGGTTILRELFDSIHPPANLSTVLRSSTVYSTLNQMKKKKFLIVPQWNTLFPSPGTCGKSKTFDITLLCKLFREICSLTAPATGWDILPSSSDLSLTADLARIKYFRNEIYGHVNEDMEMRNEEFVGLWNKIKVALVRIVKHYAPSGSSLVTDWENAIENQLTGPLTHEDEIYLEELEHWYLEDMEVKKTLGETRRTVEETRSATEETRRTAEEIRGTAEETRRNTEETRRNTEEIRDCFRTMMEIVLELKVQHQEQGLHVQVQQQEQEPLVQAQQQEWGRHVQTQQQEQGPHVQAQQQEQQQCVQDLVQPEVVIQCLFEFASGALWLSRNTLIMNQYRDDIEALETVINRVVLPTGAFVYKITFGSIHLFTKVTSFDALTELWTRYKVGKLKTDLENVFITKELLAMAQSDVQLIVIINEAEYWRARQQLQKKVPAKSTAPKQNRVLFPELSHERNLKGVSGSFDLQDDQKRWLVTGICLNNVLLPALRDFVEPEMIKHYTVLRTTQNIDKQSHAKHLRKDVTYNLNYGSINSNDKKKTHPSYDYDVKSAVDLAKLYLRPFMAKFSEIEPEEPATGLNKGETTEVEAKEGITGAKVPVVCPEAKTKPLDS